MVDEEFDLRVRPPIVASFLVFGAVQFGIDAYPQVENLCSEGLLHRGHATFSQVDALLNDTLLSNLGNPQPPPALP